MPIPEEIQERIAIFKATILDGGVEAALGELVLRHGCSIVGEALETSLREEVANEYNLEADGIYLVGSAKLGFSPKPGQYFKPFSDGSDIDLAIVSSTLYVRIWHEVNDMARAGEYFDARKFNHYHSMGWIRPDALPASAEYETCGAWWEYFRNLSSREDFLRKKISAGLYYDDSFLRRYQASGLAIMRDHIVGNGR